MNSRAFFAVSLGALWIAGCTCDDRTKRRNPKIELPNPDGSERTSIDFGLVQIDLEHTQQLRVRNGGSSVLNITKLTTAAPFGTKTELPVSVEVGEEVNLVVTYRPTVANQRHTGKLVITSDDTARAELGVDLAGQGVQAVAVVTPNPIDFKDVYLRESGKVTVTLSNAGTNELDVQDAKFSSASPAAPILSADFSQLKKKLPAGSSAQMEITFSPTQMMELTGALELTLSAQQGGAFSVPLKGRGVTSLPSLCFKWDDQGLATCTDTASTTPSMQVRTPPLCDNRLFPADAGALACTTSGANSGTKAGTFWLKNEGNIPVAYTMEWVQYPYSRSRCDGGYDPDIDFHFSNAAVLADGGTPARYSDAKTKLPLNPTDAKPWETQKVNVSYTARSRCADEAADQARVLWTRQDEPATATRAPLSILVTFDGTSKLPKAVSEGWTCGTVNSPQAVPCRNPFYAVNAGSAPLKVTRVDLYEVFPLADGGEQLQVCDFNDPLSDCYRFGWEPDGGDPNASAPHLVAAAPNAQQQTRQQIGRLAFGPRGVGCFDGGVCPNQPYKLYAIVETDDPYTPSLRVPVQGVATP